MEHEIIKKHQKLVAELAKPGAEILASMTLEKFRVWVRACANTALTEYPLSAAKKYAIYEAELPIGMQAWAEDPNLLKPESLTAEQIDLLHAATGIATEALEVLQVVLNYIAVDKLDLENFQKELGDLEFYMEQARQNQGIDRNEILSINHNKLRKRYPEGYSNEAALAQADKRIGEGRER